MSVVYNTLERIPTDGLILALDAKNPRSYDSSKYSNQTADWYDLSPMGNHFKVNSNAYETSTKTFHFYRSSSIDTGCAVKFYGDPVGINDNQLTIVSFTALGSDNGDQKSVSRWPGGACLFHMSTALGGRNNGPNLMVGGGGYASNPDIYESRLWTNFSYLTSPGGSRVASSTDIKMIWWKIDGNGWTYGLNQDTTGTNNFSETTVHTKSGGITNIGGVPVINNYFDGNGNINPDPGPQTSPTGRSELDGRMSSFFCYNRFLSSSELLDIYNKHRKIAGI